MLSDFSRTLSLLRREKKISQRKAADALGVSQALLSHYENGVREPGLSFVVAAAEYYHVSLDFLLGRTMHRDGMMIQSDDVDDISSEKDNILRGNASAMLSKKVLVNSTAVLFDVMSKWNDRQMIKDVSIYLDTAFFKAYRYVSQFDPSALPESYAVPDACFSELCDLNMKKCESRMKMNKGKEGSAPDMSYATLQSEYPRLAPSLFSLLHSVSEQLEEEMK
ncbi:MAG: helix-turn-helix transcriptional regulator [Clostridia bacterium]|nr:helix-turn-helix transcriptional regulator [Clostridia bacterium]